MVRFGLVQIFQLDTIALIVFYHQWFNIEICEVVNDCAHPQKFQFEGVVGDCYCPSTDCQLMAMGMAFPIVEILVETFVPSR